ncbi:cell surface protein [Corynebacterium sp. ACRPH]|uniref:cell surface protein n=1 Tax=Corynebacterium sp. ACRPH TaxID=2918199 RepID=UPI001EF3A613|nr:cell surface protein [Corynebacterium sp. ACRPH]MCG7456688.1 cell surface protein [Corynebacterium sp. ACRPH]
MKLSKKITATAAATILASASLLTPVANAQEKGGSPAQEAPVEGDNCACEKQPGEGEKQPGEGEKQPGESEGEPTGSSNMSKEDKIAAGIGGTIVGLGVLGAILGNAGDKGEEAPAEDEAEAPKDGEKEEAPAEGEGKPEAPAADGEAPAKEDIEAPAAEAPAEGEAEAPVAEAPAADAEAPAERNVQLANTGVKPEISILAGLALISMVAGAWMMFARRQA